MKTGRTTTLLIWLAVLLTYPVLLQAGEVIHSKTLKGNGIKANAVIDLVEDRFSEPVLGGRAENRLILKYTGSERVFYGSATWEVEVEVEVKLFAVGAATPFSTQTVTLTIDYDQTGAANYADKMVWKGSGGHRMQAKVLSVSCIGAVTSYSQLTSDFILESEIAVTRYDQFPLATNNLNPSHTVNSTNKTVLLVWDFVPGTEEFELEWLHLNKASGPSLSPFFEGRDGFMNATRISTSNNWYELNLPYEDGYLFYRVRGVGRFSQAFYAANSINTHAPDYGAWSPMSFSNIIDLADVYGDENERNWRYDVTYAEEGKRKEVLTAFDGSGRQRQMVTINNTEKDAVVMENFYDVEGRLAVQTLPAPTGSGTLAFYSDYSLNPGTLAFGKNDFDLVGTGVPTVYQSTGMHNSSGASQYYSDNNPLASTGYHAFVPDAEGLPYTRTVYGRDGRVRMQSGPGKTHSIGEGHEEVMTYAGPLQQKLDRLFGNEIGYADYFRVVMTEDANGQHSLSYQKLDGTVVATSLIGFPDKEGDNWLTDSLDHNIGDTLTASFRDDNQLNPLTNELTVDKTFLVEDNTAPYRFEYLLDSTAYNELCTDSFFSCAYILTIELYDEMDRRIYDVPEGEDVHNPWAGAPSASKLFVHYPIGEDDMPFSLEFDVYFPSVGKYRIVKRLEPDMGHAQQEFERYLAMVTDSTHPSYDNCKLEWEIAPPDLSGCITGCDSLCSYHAILAGLAYSADPLSPFQLFIDSCSTVNRCDVAPWSLEELASCDMLEAAIMRDMGPGGQYFESENLTGLMSGPDAWFNAWVIDGDNTRWAKFNFRTSQNDLIDSYQELKDNWDPAFLTQAFQTTVHIEHGDADFYFNTLIQFHPEFCALQFCKQMEESSYFDLVLQNVVTTYAQAVDSGYIHCDSLQGAMIMHSDPFFTDVADGSDYFGIDYDSLMRRILWDHDPVGTTTMWDFIVNNTESELSTPGSPCAITYTCGAIPAFTFSGCSSLDGSPVNSAYIENLVWNRFVSLYLEKKALLVRLYRTMEKCPHLYDNPEPAADYYADFKHYGSSSFADALNFNNWRATTFVIRDPFVQPPGVPDSLYVDTTGGVFTWLFPDPDSVAARIHLWAYTQTLQNLPCVLNDSTGLGNSMGRIEIPLIPFYCVDTVTGDSTFLGYRLWSEEPDIFNWGGGQRCLGMGAFDGTLGDWIVFPLGAFGDHPQGTGPACPGHDPESESFVFTVGQLNNMVSTLNSTLVYPFNLLFSGATIQNGVLKINYLSGPGIRLIISNCAGFGSPDLVINAVLDTFPTLPPCPPDEDPIVPNCLCQQMESLTDTTYFDPTDTDGCYGCTENEFIAWIFNEQYGDVWGSYEVTATMVAHWRANCSGNVAACYEFPMDLTGTCDTAAVQTYPIPRELRCWEEDCVGQILAEWEWWNDQLRQQAILERRNEFLNNYLAACMAGAMEKEDLKMSFPDREYHYTLYYYDAAGNLTRTVPPAGVQRLTGADIDAVAKHRRKPLTNPAKYPLHSPSHAAPQDELVTFYHYNTLGQVQRQTTPDGGTTEFWYDVLGRVKASQNAKQAAYTYPTYSYTEYDNLGRVTDVMEIMVNAAFGSAYTDPNTYNLLNDAGYTTYQAVGVRDLTYTEYDLSSSIHATAFGTAVGHNLRNRVAFVTRYTGDLIKFDGTTSTIAAPLFTTNTFYSYDPHGNVRELVQEHNEGWLFSNTFRMSKRMGYGYDLISGNVNSMTYQGGEADMLEHRYYYDADNRLTNVYTSTDGVVWDNDAKYFYYKHGPLARTELGDKKLQGMDYAYSIHGWLKGANSNMLTPEYDMGKDGLAANDYLGTGSEGLHHVFANDAFGFTLGYYHNISAGHRDYTMIGSGTPFEAVLPGGVGGLSNLYNGNIKHMVTSIPDPADLSTFATVGYGYRYDQLNRLKGMLAATGLAANSWAGGMPTAAWNTSYSYDPNGNILSLTRNDHTGTLMDDLGYTYNTSSGRLLNNKLASVNDPVDGGVGDIYGLHEYEYDEIGNLIKDESEEIEEIIWDAYGKVYQIKRTSTSTKPELEFRYDALGNRVMKIVKQQTGGVAHGQENWTYTIYSRDATGNVIAVYERKWESLISFASPDAAVTVQVPATTHPGKGVVSVRVNGQPVTAGPVAAGSTPASTAVNFANAVNAYEGGEMEFTAEVDGDIVFLFTDASYERPLNFEVLTDDPEFEHNGKFEYLALKILGIRPFSGSLTAFPIAETVTLQELHLYGSSRLGIKTPNVQTSKRTMKSAYTNSYGNTLYLNMLDSRDIPVTNPTAGPYFDHTKGLKQYELANHLGNVLVVFEDKKVSHEGTSGVVGNYTASLLSVQDYYPFGWTMPNRSFNSADYRFGFNGMEKTDEISGAGNHYTAEFWEYDSRIGRRWNQDPVRVAWESPYAAFRNNPIVYNDPNGDCPDCPEGTHTVQQGDTYWDLAKSSDGAYSVDDLKAWNSGVDPKKLQIGQTINVVNPNNSSISQSESLQTGGNQPSPANEYVIVNPDLSDLNVGQYAANEKPGVSGNVPFTTYITPIVNGNSISISGRVDYFNSMGDPVFFSSVAYLYGSNGELIESKSLSTKLDYSNGQQYFIPQGWTGSTTFKLMDANDIKAHNYSVKVKTSGVVSTPAGRAALTIPGSLFTAPNYGVNGFDIELKKK